MATAYFVDRSSNSMTLQLRAEDDDGRIGDALVDLVPGREFEGWTFDDLLNFEGDEIPIPKPGPEPG